MAMFYDWRNREGKGVRPLREQLRELRSPMFIALGILLLVVVVFSVRAYITGRHSSVESEKVYLLPDPPERKRALPEVLSDVVQSVERGDGFDLDSATDMRSETPDDTDSVAVAAVKWFFATVRDEDRSWQTTENKLRSIRRDSEVKRPGQVAPLTYNLVDRIC